MSMALWASAWPLDPPLPLPPLELLLLLLSPQAASASVAAAAATINVGLNIVLLDWWGESSDYVDAFCVMAGRAVVLALHCKFRFDIYALLPLRLRKLVRELLAAGAETTARRRVGGARQVALQDDPPPRTFFLRIGQRDRRQQGLRVGMGGRAVDAVDRADLGDAAEVHHRDAVGDVAD